MSYTATELDTTKPARLRTPMRLWKGVAVVQGCGRVTVHLRAPFIMFAYDLMFMELEKCEYHNISFQSVELVKE
jgi:hypothetical protein